MFVKKILYSVCYVIFLSLFCSCTVQSCYVNICDFKEKFCNLYKDYSKEDIDSRIDGFINFNDETFSDKKVIMKFFFEPTVVNLLQMIGIQEDVMMNNDMQDFYILDFIEGYYLKNEKSIVYVTLKNSFDFENDENIKRIFTYNDFQYKKIVTLRPTTLVLIRKENKTPLTFREILSIDRVLEDSIKVDIKYSCLV